MSCDIPLIFAFLEVVNLFSFAFLVPGEPPTTLIILLKKMTTSAFIRITLPVLLERIGPWNSEMTVSHIVRPFVRCWVMLSEPFII